MTRTGITRAREPGRAIRARETRRIHLAFTRRLAARLDPTAGRGYDATSVGVRGRRSGLAAATRHAATSRDRRLPARTTLRSDGSTCLAGTTRARLGRTCLTGFTPVGAARSDRARHVDGSAQAAVSTFRAATTLATFTRGRRAPGGDIDTRRATIRDLARVTSLAACASGSACCAAVGAGATSRTAAIGRRAPGAAGWNVALTRGLVVRNAIARSVHAAERIVRRRSSGGAFTVRLELL